MSHVLSDMDTRFHRAVARRTTLCVLLSREGALREGVKVDPFATAEVQPRSIAWLVAPNDWEHLEQVVYCNCSVLGGYFNALVPVREDGSMSEEYQRFLVDYDPDFVVLPRGLTSLASAPTLDRLSPYATVPWGAHEDIVPSDPFFARSERNAVPLIALLFDLANRPVLPVVAVANDQCADESRLALIACGDVKPSTSLPLAEDGQPPTVTWGYRELFLARTLRPTTDVQGAGGASAAPNASGSPFPPDRNRLADLVRPEFHFPIDLPVAALERCWTLQDNPINASLVKMTALYGRDKPFPLVTWDPAYGVPPFRIVLLVSDSFGVEEAALFWNLRAGSIRVAWMSLRSLATNAAPLGEWLDSPSGGAPYFTLTGEPNLAFASSQADLPRVHELVTEVARHRKQQSSPRCVTIPREGLVSYRSARPSISRSHVLVAESGVQRMFVPDMPADRPHGLYAVTLQSESLRLPPTSRSVRELVSGELVLARLSPLQSGTGRPEKWSYPRFRVTRDRFVRAQVLNNEPVRFNLPSATVVIRALLAEGGYSGPETSSTARFQIEFVQRAGGLDACLRYLTQAPFSDLFRVLGDNASSEVLGWLLKYPSQRRALNHLQMLQLVGDGVPTDTQSYFDTVSDELPGAVVELLSRALLERGFRLRCNSCSYTAWYPAEHVGQRFVCSRCYRDQAVLGNPLWLYKLPEVVYQGFASNMEVPLLTLGYLKRRSLASFEWIPDSDVICPTGCHANQGNIDLLCMSDGRVYLGETKTNNSIRQSQFSLYVELASRTRIDGLVFATTRTAWDRSTTRLLDNLRASYEGEVLVLTGVDLLSQHR